MDINKLRWLLAIVMFSAAALHAQPIDNAKYNKANSLILEDGFQENQIMSQAIPIPRESFPVFSFINPQTESTPLFYLFVSYGKFFLE